MAFNDVRAGWIVALVAIALTSVIGLISLSARAGSIETRVAQVEQRQSKVDANMERILDGLARIEQKVEDLEKRPSR